MKDMGPPSEINNKRDFSYFEGGEKELAEDEDD